jgi:hypothetical protein
VSGLRSALFAGASPRSSQGHPRAATTRRSRCCDRVGPSNRFHVQQRPLLALFPLDESDPEREATLLERGITSADVDAIRAAVGIVSERDERLHPRWFGAIAAVRMGSETLSAVPADAAADVLTASGLSHDDAARIIEYGVGGQAPRDDARGGVVEFLRDHGVDLRTLDELLRAAGDDGIQVRVAHTRLRE